MTAIDVIVTPGYRPVVALEGDPVSAHLTIQVSRQGDIVVLDGQAVMASEQGLHRDAIEALLAAPGATVALNTAAGPRTRNATVVELVRKAGAT